MELSLTQSTVLLLCVLFCQTADVPEARNDRPVVGILSQEYFGKFRDFKGNKSYIAASYVKWIESAGARVVPILLDRDPQYYENLVNRVNGILFPGGGQDLMDSSYTRTGRTLYQAVKDLNGDGDYFPLWTTCLGFELLTVLETGNFSLSRCDELNTQSNIGIVSDFHDLQSQTRIYANLTRKQYEDIRNKNVTYNYHRWCLAKETFRDLGLDHEFRATAVNMDKDGNEYVSVLEHKSLPVYGVQFHPEKPQFEFTRRKGHWNVPHTPLAVETGQWMGNFFVDECRKNQHNYDQTSDQQETPLIYNFTAEYTDTTSAFQQTYFFDLK